MVAVVNRWMRGLALALWGCAALLPAQAADAPSLIPLADFFRKPALSAAVMSPDGRHVAALVPGGPKKRRTLIIIDLKNVKASKIVAGFSDADINNVFWVNNDRLVFTLIDLQQPAGSQRGSGLFGVDREASLPPRRLIKSDFSGGAGMAIVDRELSVFHHLGWVLRDGSNDVIVVERLFDAGYQPMGTSLLRLDTETGVARRISLNAPGNVYGWALDPKGIPRAAETSKDGRSALYWKPTADATEWTLLREFSTFGDDERSFGLIGVGNDNRLYAAGNAGADTDALLRIEVRGRELKSEPVLAVKGYDYTGRMVTGADGTLLGVHYVSDAPGTQWFDARLKALQEKVDALLPSTANRIDCGQCSDPATLLVASGSDRQPTVYRLYDVASGKLDLLAASRPWIDPRQMAVRDFQRFNARDGLSIPVHITRPRGVKGPAPAVLLVHGGPWVRGGDWRWDDESQFLASRGYVVIEPEFRGSTGYGHKLFRAGWKQWGLAMQDDLVDAVNWAAKQGLVDPQRVCIAGASYGGYATLMGLIRDPDVYRCGVEWVGVSDIELLYSIHWSDSSEMYKSYGMPVLVGDRVKDAAQLAATSPLKRAAQLKRPLLMAYGSVDRRVPLEHGNSFHDAVKRNNADVEFTVYPGEGHGFLLEANEVDFWGRVERFLGRHLGPGATPP